MYFKAFFMAKIVVQNHSKMMFTVFSPDIKWACWWQTHKSMYSTQRGQIWHWFNCFYFQSLLNSFKYQHRRGVSKLMNGSLVEYWLATARRWLFFDIPLETIDYPIHKTATYLHNQHLCPIRFVMPIYVRSRSQIQTPFKALKLFVTLMHVSLEVVDPVTQ